MYAYMHSIVLQQRNSMDLKLQLPGESLRYRSVSPLLLFPKCTTIIYNLRTHIALVTNALALHEREA